MKTIYSVLVEMILILSLSSQALAGESILIGTSNGEAEVLLLKAELESKGEAAQILKARSGKYGNDNSFVQLYNAAPPFNNLNVRVEHRKIYLILPTELTYDTLLEVLFKIRAARTFGASQVIVQTRLPLKQVRIHGELAEELPLEQFLAIAGADKLLTENKMQELSEVKPKRNAVTQIEYGIGGTNHPELLREIADLLGKHPLSFDSLRADPKTVLGKKIYWVMGLQPPVNDQLFTTLGQIHWLEKHGASVHLISPYLPYARSDKPEFDVGVTTQGRLVADLIESVRTEGITVVRAHAPQSLGFFRIHSEEISGRKTIVKHLRDQDIDCVISPDAGFQKDATKYQTELIMSYQNKKNVCLVVMNKSRDSDGNEKMLGGTGLEEVTGKNLVIIDDETATGGTLAQVAEGLKAYHPKSIHAVVTHLAGNAKHVLNSDAVSSLVVTNTVPVPASFLDKGSEVRPSKLKKLSIASEIAESIAQSERNR